MERLPLGFLPLGASYYPPHHSPDDWPIDVDNMRAAGMNVIRTAEIGASWDYIEPVRGQPDFSYLDRLFALAETPGEKPLRIILGTGSNCPPIWLVEWYPDAQIVSRDGVPYPTRSVWGWACKENPGYRREVKRYIELLLERYRSHPALLAWQVDNEPGFPLIPHGPRPTIDHYCYCRYHQQGFVEWLQQKYGTIDALNEAWRWIPTWSRYKDWSQVKPPRSMPSEWGCVTAWLDWQTYQYDALASFMSWQNGLINGQDSLHPTYTNIYCWAGQEELVGIDCWRLAKTCDAIGYDLYPGTGNRWNVQPEYVSMFLDTAASSARQASLHLRREVPFWVTELESGPVGGWASGPPRNTTALDIKRYNLEVLGHGAKMILYQGYREWNDLPVHRGALVDLGGRPTSRYRMAQSLNRMIAEHEEMLLQAKPMPAGIAVLDDPSNRTILFGTGGLSTSTEGPGRPGSDYTNLRLAARGCYQTLWSQGYRVDFVSPEGLSPDMPYKMICLPCGMLISRKTGQILRDWVAQRGGILVGSARCAYLNDRGWYWERQPGAGLDEVFGVAGTGIAISASPDLSVNLMWQPSTKVSPQPVLGYLHRQSLDLADDASVLARFADNSPAIVSRDYGNGKAFYMATHLDAAVTQYHSPVAYPGNIAAIRAIYKYFTRGIHPTVVKTVTLIQPSEMPLPDLLRQVDAHLLQSGDSYVVIITNNGPTDVNVSLRLPDVGHWDRAVDLFTGEVLPGGSALTLTLAAWDGAIYHIIQ